MKKILTAAALIAAGTAFAGATEYETAGDTFTATTEWPTSSNSGNYYGIQITTDNIANLYDGSSWTTETIDTGDTYQVSSISIALNSYSATKAGTTYMLLVDSSFTVVGISAVAVCQTGLQADSSNSNKSYDTYTFSDTTVITSGDTYYLLGVTSAGASYYSVGSTVSSDDYGTYASQFRVLVDSDSDGDPVAVTTTATNALLESTYSSSSYSAILRYELTAVTVIPEPSSFGLLAGIGALALVVARRRRSR